LNFEGVIVGVFGCLTDIGEFLIKDLQFAEIQPQKSIQSTISNQLFH
jgi:hypothetical protein